MSDAAVQQPSPTKRGRGRGRGGAGRGAASARARGKPATGRRGRAKVYETSRAQAAHERQRDLKNAYSTLAAAMKPALEELADRNLDRLKSDFNAHKEVDQYRDITSFLDRRRQDRLSEISTKLAYSIACQTHQHEAQQEYTAHSFKNRCADKVEEYYDVLLSRLDKLNQLSQKREPIDTLDDSYNYKSITTEEAAEQGIYRKIHKGVEVPYPQLQPELVQEANKSKALRTPSKRKLTGQLLEDHATPKRPVSSLDDKTGTAIPRHIGGLLSAVAPDEPVSRAPSPSPDEDADAPSPPANDRATTGRGKKRKPQPAAMRAASTDAEESDAEEDDMLPPIPNGASEPDEYGVRLVNKRARVNDMPNNRIMLPPLFEFESHEIGFRDSTNDKSRGATKAKRRKFLNQPNSGAMFFDRNLCSYDATQYADGELDSETVAKHGLHAKYGLFLNQSHNESEPPRPYESGWKPTVFVSDSGKILHTSRSIAAAKAEESYKKLRLKEMMRKFMEKEELTEEDLDDPETERLIRERDDKRRQLERQEEAAQVEQDEQMGAINIGMLLEAAVASEAQEAQESQQTSRQSASPAVDRPSTMSRPYDAVRDVFGGSGLQPASSTAPPVDNSAAMGLLCLADIALRDAEGPATQAPAAETRQQIPIQMPEPVRPKQLRDPSDLEQGDHPLVVYPDPENEFIPRQLAYPEHFISRDQVYAVQPPLAYQERTVQQSPLAHPESFSYREPGGTYEQQHTRQFMQPPQPYLGQQGTQQPLGPPEPYGYGEPEHAFEQAQLRRSSQVSLRSEDQYAPPRPNTEDVALLDPQLFEGGQRPGISQLQAPQPEQTSLRAPQPSGVLQQPQNSFFQTALNSPRTPTVQDHLQATDLHEPPQLHQQSGPPLAPSSRPPLAAEGSPRRTPFSNPNGADAQPLPPLRPLHRGSGSLMAPAAQGSQPPQRIRMMLNEPQEPYPPSQPSAHAYMDQGYAPNGYSPDQPILSTEQGPRPGYMAQPTMHPLQQPGPPGYPAQQSYPPPAPAGSQAPLQFDTPLSGPPGQIMQSPPPYGANGQAISPSPGRSNSISSTRNNKPYREIKPAPRSSESWETNGSELRTLIYNPYEGIRDYSATAPPPSHGPTQIRGWTHTTGTRKSRGKNSTDSQVDPSLGREQKKAAPEEASVTGNNQKRRRVETSLERSKDDEDSDAAASGHTDRKDHAPSVVRRPLKSLVLVDRTLAKRAKKTRSPASTPPNPGSSKDFGGNSVDLDADDVEVTTQGPSPARGAPTEDEAPPTMSPETVEEQSSTIASERKSPSPPKSTYNLRSGGKRVRWADIPDK